MCPLHPFQATNDQHLSQAEQRSSMEAVYNGHDVFVWLPTGYGKSLCYQALPTSSSLVPGPSTRGEGLGTRLLQARPYFTLYVRPSLPMTSRNIYSVLIVRMRRQCVPGLLPALSTCSDGSTHAHHFTTSPSNSCYDCRCVCVCAHVHM